MPKDLQELQAKIIKAVPSIVELKFGDKFKHKGEVLEFRFDYGDSICYVKDLERAYFNKKYFLENCEILGRPILLEDVLFAIGQDYSLDIEITPDNEKQITIKRMKADIYDGGSYPDKYIKWLLNTPLHLQSDETISELNKLIK